MNPFELFMVYIHLTEQWRADEINTRVLQLVVSKTTFIFATQWLYVEIHRVQNLQSNSFYSFFRWPSFFQEMPDIWLGLREQFVWQTIDSVKNFRLSIASFIDSS